MVLGVEGYRQRSRILKFLFLKQHLFTFTLSDKFFLVLMLF